MGADENAAIMRRAYEAFNSGDMDTLIELFDESAERAQVATACDEDF